MSDVKRYDLLDQPCELDEGPNGEWVKYEDYQALALRLDTVSRLNETNLAALLAMNELARGYEDRLDAVRGWLDSYGEDVGGVRSGELLGILDGAVETNRALAVERDSALGRLALALAALRKIDALSNDDQSRDEAQNAITAVENQMPFITREDIEKAALEPLPWDGRDMLVIKKTPE